MSAYNNHLDFEEPEEDMELTPLLIEFWMQKYMFVIGTSYNRTATIRDQKPFIKITKHLHGKAHLVELSELEGFDLFKLAHVARHSRLEDYAKENLILVAMWRLEMDNRVAKLAFGKYLLKSEHIPFINTFLYALPEEYKKIMRKMIACC